MPYCINCFTKILTLAIAPFLFILVGIICEFAIVIGVYILFSSQEEKVHYKILPEGTDVKIQQHIMVFIMRPRGTLKFQFIFAFNECL